MKQKKSGFTLIELLVVSTIIVVLAVIGMVSFTQAAKGARDGKRKADMETIRQGLTLYKQQNATYPAAYSSLAGTYLSEPIPVDPGSYTYTYYGGGTTFCVCAQMENGKGNTLALPSNSSCSGLGGTTTGSYQCAKNL